MPSYWSPNPKDLTKWEKIALYRAGHYQFKSAPVCTAGWSESSWIMFIDSYKGWSTFGTWADIRESADFHKMGG